MRKVVDLLLLSAFLLFVFSCTKPKQETLLVNGAGASFPYILYSKWLSEYRKVNPSVAINYQSIGSGGGIRQFLKGTLDFGATDVPVSSQEIKKSSKKIIHIPTALGAVAVTYNLKTVKKNLYLDGKTLSDIFMGKIKKWNHVQIQNMNKGVSLPDKDIVVIYRADGSGTTAFFTEFLSQSSKSFLEGVGKGKSVNWPVGIGGKGNEGVMGLVSKLEGSISYISLSYALSQKLKVAKIKNKEGHFVSPNTQTIKAAAASLLKVNKGVTSSLIYARGKNSYPLSGFTYILVSKKMPKEKGQAIVGFLKWCLNSGQNFSESLHFIPLPDAVIQKTLKDISQIQYE